MFMKDAAFLEQLQQELPRRSLSPKATQRFEDTYKMLGVQQEAPVKSAATRGCGSRPPPPACVAGCSLG